MAVGRPHFPNTDDFFKILDELVLANIETDTNKSK